MKNLISKFQEKLHISKENAVFRVVMLLFFVVCFVTTIIFTLVNFPYHYNYPVSKISVPNGNYEVTVNIIEQGIQLSEKSFNDQLLPCDTIFIYGKDTHNFTIFIFMVNKNGTSFYFKKYVMGHSFYFYEINQISIDNGVLVIEKVRSASKMFFRAISLPVLLLLIFSCLAYITQFKKDGYGYDENGKFTAKYLEVWI